MNTAVPPAKFAVAHCVLLHPERGRIEVDIVMDRFCCVALMAAIQRRYPGSHPLRVNWNRR